MDKKIYKIGLTGPSGAGKSLFAHFFSCMEIPVLDADEIYHSLVNTETECLRELGREFGSELTEGGRLNRRALRAIVFAKDGKERLVRLNEITHKHVIKRTDELICELYENGHRVFLVDAPLLIEAEMHRDCDAVITVSASEDVRCERLMKRDNVTKEDAMLAINAQKPLSFYENASDYVIQNDGNRGKLEDEFRKLYARLGLSQRR